MSVGIDVIVVCVVVIALFVKDLATLSKEKTSGFSLLFLSLSLFFFIFKLFWSSFENLTLYIQNVQASLMPMLFALVFFVISKMIQYKIRRDKASDEAGNKELMATLIKELNGYFKTIDTKMEELKKSNPEKENVYEIKTLLNDELANIERIIGNQSLILDKFEEVGSQQQETFKALEKYTAEDVIDLDKTMHSHIDVLRVLQKDYLEKITHMIEGANTEKLLQALDTRIGHIENEFERLNTMVRTSGKLIVKDAKGHVESLLFGYKNEFEQMKADLSSVTNQLNNFDLFTQKLIASQHALDANFDKAQKNLGGIIADGVRMEAVYKTLNELIDSLVDISQEYSKSKREAESLVQILSKHTQNNFTQLEEILTSLSGKIDELEVKTGTKSTETFQNLSKAKLLENYTSDNS